MTPPPDALYTQWFLRPLGDGSGARVMPTWRLLGFAYAGGNATSFRRWHHGLGPEVEFWALKLPGRGSRRGEPACTDLGQMAQAVAEAVQSFPPDLPLAIFGHSMGALLAFEVALRLQQLGGYQPRQLLLSGRGAPGVLQGSSVFEPGLSDQAFIARLRELEGTPREVLNDAQLLARALPSLRADLQMLADWRDEGRHRWRGKLLTLAGARDVHAEPAAVAAWSTRVDGATQHVVLPGGHFFVHSHESAVWKALREALGLSRFSAAAAPIAAASVSPTLQRLLLQRR